MFVIWKTLSYDILSYNHDGKNLKKNYKSALNLNQLDDLCNK